MANTFLAAQGIGVGKSLCEHDLADTARDILAKAKVAGCEVILPRDIVVSREFKAGAASETLAPDACPDDAMILDAGPATVAYIAQVMEGAKTLVWNGPLGAFEIPPFDMATVAAARRFGATLASHDDTTEAHVATSQAQGVRVAEFPTTAVAAQACRAAGIAVIMGAPNLVRGGSHSGNVAAAELADAGLLDILSSDYIPAALLYGAVKLGRRWEDMARGIATVTANPAQAVGLTDRGRIAVGLRADLLRFAEVGGVPLSRGLWVQGARVA